MQRDVDGGERGEMEVEERDGEGRKRGGEGGAREGWRGGRRGEGWREKWKQATGIEG